MCVCACVSSIDCTIIKLARVLFVLLLLLLLVVGLIAAHPHEQQQRTCRH